MKKYLIIFIFLIACGANETTQIKKFSAALAGISIVQTYVVCRDTVDLPNDSLQLIGRACSNDSPVTKTAWTQLSGPVSLTIGKGDSPYVINLASGLFVLQYTATNSQGVSGFGYDTLLINPAPVPPVEIQIPKTIITTVLDQNGKIIKADTIKL